MISKTVDGYIQEQTQELTLKITRILLERLTECLSITTPNNDMRIM